jgi:hypothetical protein
MPGLGLQGGSVAFRVVSPWESQWHQELGNRTNEVGLNRFRVRRIDTTTHIDGPSKIVLLKILVT